MKREPSLNSRMKIEPSPKPIVKSEPKVKSEPREDVKWSQLEPGVKSELKEAVQRPQLQGIRLRSVAKVNSQGEAKLAPGTEAGKQWYLGPAENISCTNEAKHIKRIHPRAIMVKRGRPKGNGKTVGKGSRRVRYLGKGIDIS